MSVNNVSSFRKSLTATFILLIIGANAQTIDLKLRAATFTNLQSRVFENVQLVNANADGVVWETLPDKDGNTKLGMVIYTNLDCSDLASWGVPTNRAQIYIKRMAAQKEAAKIAKEKYAQAVLDWQKKQAIEREKAVQSQIAWRKYMDAHGGGDELKSSGNFLGDGGR
jgi:hypothetical protein